MIKTTLNLFFFQETNDYVGISHLFRFMIDSAILMKHDVADKERKKGKKKKKKEKEINELLLVKSKKEDLMLFSGIKKEEKMVNTPLK